MVAESSSQGQVKSIELKELTPEEKGEKKAVDWIARRKKMAALRKAQEELSKSRAMMQQETAANNSSLGSANEID